ncbi:glycosyltransferase 61 family protein [uncultured Jatrophihabitans sp.]|uniref:glycosyltransferase family 61 protein n=1 Tax=uncultured Jatrophihabitans sp. TaxID=1610747 RepID=UPI0035CC5C96
MSRVPAAVRRRVHLLGGPLAHIGDRLPAGADRLVVLVVDGTRVPLMLWRRSFRHDRTVVIRHDDELAATSLAIAALGPVDVLVDLLAGPGVDHRRVWEALFLHVRRDGAYLLGRTGRGHGRGARTLRAWWRSAPERIETPLAGPSPDLELANELAGSLGRVSSGPHALLVQQRQRHWWKVREAAIPELLPRRDRDLSWTDLQVLPAGSFRPTTPVTHHGSTVPQTWLDERIDHPAMRVRHYAGDLAFAGHMLVHTENTILPDSYSWPLAADPNNPFAVSGGREFARVADARVATERLPGNYYLLDPNYDEYGHVLTEVVGRLWGWDEAKARIPDLKALFWVREDGPDVTARPKFRFAEAYGIAARDIVRTVRPVRVDSLVTATPMWHNRSPYYVHPQLRDVWRRLAHGFGADTAPSGQRIFIGRSGDFARRVCRNDADVQRFFVERGFRVVYPEHLDVAQQATLFAGAHVVAGYAGSALFNVLFAHHLQALLVLTHHSYTARNEHLFGAGLGVPVHYFWSRADISHPADRKTFAAVESPWEFDFAANQAALDDVLARI